MQVKIEVGKPIAVPADTSGPGYNLYPVTVKGEHDKRLLRATLSVDGSGVAEASIGLLTFQVSGRDYKPGAHDLFASVWDGTETATATSTINIAGAATAAPPLPAAK